ncbi:hypothetical protein [Amycolatopsis sp. NPDC051371]
MPSGKSSSGFVVEEHDLVTNVHVFMMPGGWPAVLAGVSWPGW